MNDRLGVYQHRYPFGRYAEQPVRLDHLESFIDQRGAVDRDLVAHPPLGMLQCLFHRYVSQLLAAAVAESSAAASDDQPSHGRLFSRQALEDRRVFRVDRDDRGFVPGCQRHHVTAARHQRFFVGQRHLFACFDRRYRRHQAGVAHQGVHDYIDLPALYDLPQGFLAGIYLDRRAVERLPQGVVSPFVGDHHAVGVELHGLPGEPLPVAMGRKGRDLEQSGIFPNDVEGLYSDGSGRSEQGDSLFHNEGQKTI